MPNNTYKGDIGIKYNFVKDEAETDEKKTDDIFADADAADDEEDQIYDEDFPEDANEPEHIHNDDISVSDEEHSALYGRERKYNWEKPPAGGDKGADAEFETHYQKSKKVRTRTVSDDDENYDFEIGNNAAGLKILMGLMLIIFIVIISVLIYKMNLLNNDYQAALAKLEEVPSEQELNNAKADILAKEASIRQLTDQLSQYKVESAAAGDLIETPEGSVYVVAANDTLGKIAQEYKVDINQIMEWNNLDNADSIKVGQRLIVKKPEDTAQTTTAAEPAN